MLSRLSAMLILVGLWIACQSPRKTVTTVTPPHTTDPAPAASAPVQETAAAEDNYSVPVTSTDSLAGLKAIAASDCAKCHHADQRLAGPAYMDIARRSLKDKRHVEMLARKIIKGGFGAWNMSYMPPHPDMPVETAETIVKYILSLKK